MILFRIYLGNIIPILSADLIKGILFEVKHLLFFLFLIFWKYYNNNWNHKHII